MIELFLKIIEVICCFLTYEIETFLGNEMYDTLINKWNKELSEKTYFDLMGNLY